MRNLNLSCFLALAAFGTSPPSPAIYQVALLADYRGEVDAVAHDGLDASMVIAAFRTLDAKGAVTAHQTRYVSDWRRDSAGQWRIWVDIGNAGPGLESLVK